MCAVFLFGGNMDKIEANQRVTLINRRELTIDSVKNVDALGEDFVDLTTDAGKITVEGDGLKIEELNQERHFIIICGYIDSIAYINEKKTSSLFKKRNK